MCFQEFVAFGAGDVGGGRDVARHVEHGPAHVEDPVHAEDDRDERGRHVDRGQDGDDKGDRARWNTRRPDPADVTGELRGRLEQWMQDTDDPLLTGPVPPPPGAEFNDPDQQSAGDPVSIG